MADEKLTAATRLEKLLDNIAGGENEVTPATRLEKFLSYIADAIEGESGGSGGTLYGPYLATNVSTVEFGTNATIIFGVASIFQNRLRITDNDGNIKGWIDGAKCLLSGIEIPSSTTVIAVGSSYSEPPAITVRKLVDTLTSVSAETITIQFYTDVELLFELA